MSASQRRKGAGYEREIVQIVRQMTDSKNISRNLSQSRDGGGDILLRDYVIECKRRKRLSLSQWMRQASAACVGVQKPLVVTREDDGENYAIIRLVDLLSLLKRDHV